MKLDKTKIENKLLSGGITDWLPWCFGTLSQSQSEVGI